MSDLQDQKSVTESWESSLPWLLYRQMLTLGGGNFSLDGHCPPLLIGGILKDPISNAGIANRPQGSATSWDWSQSCQLDDLMMNWSGSPFWLKGGCKERLALNADVREEQLLNLSLQALGWLWLAEGLYLKWVWWQQTDPLIKSDLHCNEAHWSSALWKSNKIFNLNYLFKMLNRVETNQVVWSFHFSPGLCLWLHRYCSKALGKGWINYSIIFLWRNAGRLESKLRITMFPVLKLGPLIFRERALSIFKKQSPFRCPKLKT